MVDSGVMRSPGRAVTGAASVLCVGQATLDHVLTVADEIVAGGKHVAQRHDVVGGGLAANAAVTVARLGGAAALASVIGDDETANNVLAGLRAEHVDIRLVQQVAGVATPFSAVIVSANGARTIVNHNPTELLARPCPDLEEVVCDAVLVDGRWPAGTTGALSLARRRGVPGVVDVDRSAVDAAVIDTCLDLASHLVFSEDALRDLTGTTSATDGLRRISRDTRAHVSVTLGERGVVWVDGDDVRSLAAFAVDAVDTTGAGDVFHGAATLALAEGADEARAFAFASAAAALKCTRPGARAGVPSRPEVDDLLDRTSNAREVAAR
jgi:sulfofructose kinase